MGRDVLCEPCALDPYTVGDQEPILRLVGVEKTLDGRRYTPLLQIWEDPTVNAVGTVLWQGLLLSSRVSAGDTNDSAMEFILKNNTSYLVRFTSAGATNQVLIRLVWYEDLGV